jgi:hypothetical protein
MLKENPKPGWRVFLSPALTVLLTLAAVAGVQANPASSPLYSSKYQVFAFNDLGMHCFDKDFSVFSLLPPFNVIHCQVVYKGLKPRLLNNARIVATYSGILDPNGSINSTSGFVPGTITQKTNFWNYMGPLLIPWFNDSYYGWPVDVGILGFKMPSSANGPQALVFDPNPWPDDPKLQWFSATGIPVTDVDDDGNINNYPMMRIQAALGTPRRSQAVSSLDIVLPTSSEFRCAACHETDSWIDADNAAGIDWVASDGSPPPRLADFFATNNISFSDNPNFDLRFRENILILHDAMNGTQLFDQYQPPSGDPGQSVLCAECHYSKALDLNDVGPDTTQASHFYLSRAMHKHHGAAWPMGDGSYGIPIPGEGVTQCYFCHPGNDTQCLRSVMAGVLDPATGEHLIQCQSCHGGLLSVAGFTSELAQDGFVTDTNLPNINDPESAELVIKLTTGPHRGRQRQPWVDLPKCQSCHSGDALDHPADKIVSTQAYLDKNAESASPILAPKSRFAENNMLYRFSQTHGGMACEACHGSTHAEWPAQSGANKNINDNVTAIALQGHMGEIAECGACHGRLMPPGLKGPHGLHNVNDPIWGRTHGVFYWRNRTSCQACHGKDLKGTLLSRAKADRVLQNRGRQYVSVSRGTKVNCYDCHHVIR